VTLLIVEVGGQFHDTATSRSEKGPCTHQTGALDVVANSEIPASVRNQVSVVQSPVGHYTELKCVLLISQTVLVTV